MTVIIATRASKTIEVMDMAMLESDAAARPRSAAMTPN